jgi:hypothetical protein
MDDTDDWWCCWEHPEFKNRAIQVLLAAIMTSNSQLKELSITIYMDEEGRTILINELDVPAAFGTQVKSSFRPLEHLHLIVDSEERCMNTEWIQGYIKFVELFPQISHLQMEFNHQQELIDLAESRFGLIFVELQMPNLRALTICWAIWKIDTVLQLLQRHSVLKKLHLRCVRLRGGQRQWQTFFA